MSRYRKGLRKCKKQISSFSVYISWRNHYLALSLAHHLETYSALESLNKLLLCLWKLFECSLMKQAVSENVQKVDDLKVLKTEKLLPHDG